MATTKKGQPVDMRETVEIIGIEHENKKKQQLKPGKKYNVHPLTAENLIKTGHAELPGKKNKKSEGKASGNEE